MFGMRTGSREGGVERVPSVARFILQADFGSVIAEDCQLLDQLEKLHACPVLRIRIRGVRERLEHRNLLSLREADKRLAAFRKASAVNPSQNTDQLCLHGRRFFAVSQVKVAVHQSGLGTGRIRLRNDEVRERVSNGI